MRRDSGFWREDTQATGGMDLGLLEERDRGYWRGDLGLLEGRDDVTHFGGEEGARLVLGLPHVPCVLHLCHCHRLFGCCLLQHAPCTMHQWLMTDNMH